MKKISTYSFMALLIYASLMIYKSPNISDALVVLALAGLSGFLFNLDYKKELAKPANYTDEMAKLEYQYNLEKLKFQLDDAKFHNARQQAVRDEMSEKGVHSNKIFF